MGLTEFADLTRAPHRGPQAAAPLRRRGAAPRDLPLSRLRAARLPRSAAAGLDPLAPLRPSPCFPSAPAKTLTPRLKRLGPGPHPTALGTPRV